MLVLTRKGKEEIRIGNDITVTIVRVKGQSVRIGINAPEHVRVMRSELVTPNDSGADGRGSQRQRCDGSAAPRDTQPNNSGDATAVGASGRRDTSHGVDVSSQHPKATDADECGCQTRHSPIGSTTAFARVVARRRQNRLDQWLPPR